MKQFYAVVLFVFLIPVPTVHGDQYLGENDQKYWKQFWPKNVEFPKGLKFYNGDSMPRASQYLVINNGQDYNGVHWWGHHGTDDRPQLNPNKKFPYAFPGGMDNIPRNLWFNVFGVTIPKGKSVRYWTERVPVPMASRWLPQLKWEFPEGTEFVDLLCACTPDGKTGWPFELRMSTKTKNGWDDRVEWKAPEADRPIGFKGAGKKCIECHQQAGASENYGVSIRGSDRRFSWYPFTKESISYNSGHVRTWIDSDMLDGWAE
jgi:hypothetical protein